MRVVGLSRVGPGPSSKDCPDSRSEGVIVAVGEKGDCCCFLLTCRHLLASPHLIRASGTR